MTTNAPTLAANHATARPPANIVPLHTRPGGPRSPPAPVPSRTTLKPTTPVSAPQRVRALLVQHRHVTIQLLSALAGYAHRSSIGDVSTVPDILPSSYLREAIRLQHELDRALDDLQHHLTLHSQATALTTAMHAQNNQIVALIRTLYSAHQALDLVLDQARARVAAATAPKPVVPRDVIQYANLLSGQTSAPAFPPNPRMRPAKLAAFPDEAAMLSGALMHQDASLELVGVPVDSAVPDGVGVGTVPIVGAAAGQAATPLPDGGVVDYDTASVPVTENVSTSMASLSGFGDLEDLMDEDGALDLDL